MSSELQFSSDLIEPKSILLTISQSGESADVLEAVRIAKNVDCKIISIVNSFTSSLALESNIIIGMNCGPEIGVASTKSFTSQLTIIYKIAKELFEDKLKINFDDVASSISKILDNHSQIKKVAKDIKGISNIYVLGRGIHFPIAMEAALKIKELTHIHAEGIPGGELKHGPLALMDSNVFVIIINPKDNTYSDTITSAREIKDRGAKIIGVSDEKNDVYDYWLEIPKTNESIYPFTEIISCNYYHIML